MSRKLNAIKALKTEVIEVESDFSDCHNRTVNKQKNRQLGDPRMLDFLHIKPWNPSGRVLLSIESRDGRNIMSVSRRENKGAAD